MSQLDLNDDSRIGKILSLADEKLNQPKEKKVIKFLQHPLIFFIVYFFLPEIRKYGFVLLLFCQAEDNFVK